MMRSGPFAAAGPSSGAAARLWQALGFSLAFGASALGAPAPAPSASAPPAAPLPPAAQRPVDFAKDIQPLLAANCYSCHGPDKQKGDLRWDQKASVFGQRDGEPVLVVSNSAASRVIKLVAGQDPDSMMPPRGEPLSAEQIGLLRAWIDQGAAWPEGAVAQATTKHWAFKAPVRPPVPAVKTKAWVRNPIDAFVLARLEREKLRPAPEAERTTLLRRLSLDLTGLPPTPLEIDDFLSDHQPGAYERVVERLLASPHYGERWGRHWLDAARYADTNGYEKDRARSIWPYRDWVIRALNQDLPYDQFVIEQLAGDLLPGATLDQRVATGFLRNAMLNQEGGIEPEQFRVEALIDRVDCIGKACLGLTLNCCQCHNHKFDPFSQKEYYQLFALLNQDDEAFAEVPTAEEQKKRDEILARVHAAEEKAMAGVTNLTERMAAWEKSLAEIPTQWSVLEPKDWFNFAIKFEKQPDNSLLGGGDLEPGSVMQVWLDTTLTNITGLRLEALTNANLMYGGPGSGGKGTFLIKEFTVEAWAMEHPTVTNKVKFRRAVADAQAPGFEVAKAIDGNDNKGGWCPTATPDERNQNHWAVFECEQPIGFPGGTHLLVTLHEKFDNQTKLESHMLGSLRLSATTNTGPLLADPLSPDQRSWLSVPVAARTPEQKRELFNAFRRWDTSFSELNRELDKAWEGWPYPATTLVLQQRATPRVTHLFKRGDRLRPGEVVEPGTPAVLNPFPADAPRNRLGLAKWMVDRRNPTTARAIVNRIWQAYFGQGLVTTPEDFGTRVETPSHPELLDWLACELMEPQPMRSAERGVRNQTEVPRAWSLKHIHRLIVESATYRQSSRITPPILARDPYDRLLERGPRFRVEGEVVQDIALSVSGLLNPKIGGPSVYPPIPASVGDTSYGGFQWPETKGEDRYRRGLYTFWKRSLPFPSLSAFDVPSGETACPRRVRSDTPLQALTTLNEKTFVEAAQALALRIMSQGGATPEARARYGFRLCTGRVPSPDETRKLLGFWQEQYDYFENRTAEALKVAVADMNKIPPDVNLHKAAAWAMVSRALLNLDETITKE